MKRDYYSDTFLYPHELTKIVLRSSTKYFALNCTFWPSELNQKSFSCFSAKHIIQGETKGSSCFGTVRLFFSEKCFSLKSPPSILLLFCVRMDVGKSQRVLFFSFFSALWDFFPENKNFPLSIFRCFATEWMLKNPKVSYFSIFFGTVKLLFRKNVFP